MTINASEFADLSGDIDDLFDGVVDDATLLSAIVDHARRGGRAGSIDEPGLSVEALYMMGMR